jgi:hypothetical protein
LLPSSPPMWRGYSRLIGADEDSTLQVFKTIRAELFAPTIEVHNGRLAETTGMAARRARSVVEGSLCGGGKARRARFAVAFEPGYLSGSHCHWRQAARLAPREHHAK